MLVHAGSLHGWKALSLFIRAVAVTVIWHVAGEYIVTVYQQYYTLFFQLSTVEKINARFSIIAAL